jgi:hypothetical protein
MFTTVNISFFVYLKPYNYKCFKSLFQSTLGQYAHVYTVHITKRTIQSNGQCHNFIT